MVKLEVIKKFIFGSYGRCPQDHPNPTATPQPPQIDPNWSPPQTPSPLYVGAGVLGLVCGNKVFHLLFSYLARQTLLLPPYATPEHLRATIAGRQEVSLALSSNR